jgi:hypothetical protein
MELYPFTRIIYHDSIVVNTLQGFFETLFLIMEEICAEVGENVVRCLVFGAVRQIRLKRYLGLGDSGSRSLRSPAGMTDGDGGLRVKPEMTDGSTGDGRERMLSPGFVSRAFLLFT